MGARDELLRSLARVADEADRLRNQASQSLRGAVGRAAEQGLAQAEIAGAIRRSQPEVSRLIKAYRARRFTPASPLGKRLAAHRDDVVALAEAHKLMNVRVFGSVARGQDDDASDIDLLVDLAPGADLFDLASFDIELEGLLGHRVDVMPARMLKPHVAESAFAEAVAL